MATVSAPQLSFFDDVGQHEYRLDGIKIPSVTSILSFGQDLSRIPAWTSQRGTALHLATEYDDVGDLDEDSVDPLVLPHLIAYRKWKVSAAPVFVATEIRVWGEIEGMRYCGTIDRVVAAMTSDTGVEILDVKSGAPRKEHGAQVQAYAAAYRQRTGARVRSCAGLYVGKDETWELRQYYEAHLEMFVQKLRAYYAAQGE